MTEALVVGIVCIVAAAQLVPRCPTADASAWWWRPVAALAIAMVELAQLFLRPPVRRPWRTARPFCDLQDDGSRPSA